MLQRAVCQGEKAMLQWARRNPAWPHSLAGGEQGRQEMEAAAQVMRLAGL